MRKIISLILLVSIIFSFSSCNNTTTEHIDNIEHTNKELKVYIPDITNLQLQEVVESYEKKYPDVKLIVCDQELYGVTTEEELCQKISAEIMAGKGPDIFAIGNSMWDKMLFEDINKTMRSGVFYDINELLKQDKIFNNDDYLEVAMKSGEYEGKQYIFPLAIETPFLLTTKQTLENTNINLKECKTVIDFTKQIKSYVENRSNDDNKDIFSIMTRNGYLYLDLLNWIDYENQRVNLNTSQVKETFETLMLVENKTNFIDYEPNALKDNNLLFLELSMSNDMLKSCALINDKVEPILHPHYNNEGKIQARTAVGIAINANSLNKKNAYNFLKLALDWKREPYNIDRINEYNKRMEVDQNIPKEQYLYNCPQFFSTSKEQFEYDLDYVKRIYDTGHLYNEYYIKYVSGIEDIEIKPLPKEVYDEIRKIYYDIDVCTFFNTANKKAVEIMEPYIKGEKSYEECIKEAQDKLKIYISE